MCEIAGGKTRYSPRSFKLIPPRVSKYSTRRADNSTAGQKIDPVRHKPHQAIRLRRPVLNHLQETPRLHLSLTVRDPKLASTRLQRVLGVLYLP